MNEECKNCGELFPSQRMLEIHQKYCREDIGIPWEFETTCSLNVDGKLLERGRRIRKVKTRHQFEDWQWYYHKEQLECQQVEAFPEEIMQKMPLPRVSETTVKLDETRWFIYFSDYVSSHFGEESWTKEYYLILDTAAKTLQICQFTI